MQRSIVIIRKIIINNTRNINSCYKYYICLNSSVRCSEYHEGPHEVATNFKKYIAEFRSHAYYPLKFAEQVVEWSTAKCIRYRVYRDTMGPRKYRASPYQVCITILEAKHLPQNANPLVVVKVGNRKRKTVVRERTDAPAYNEVMSRNDISTRHYSTFLYNTFQYFVFDLFCNVEQLLSTKIMIAVYLKNYVRLKFHGSTSFEIALVWGQPGDLLRFFTFSFSFIGLRGEISD